MDLDLGQVRAFVAVVDHGHFGRAANALTLSQQALSKRVARLEAKLGRLLERRRGGVVTTPAGERFLPAARRLLELADHAVADVRDAPAQPLRVDVWSDVQTPAAIMRAFGREHPGLALELSMRRDLGEALAALERHELDLAFGNVAALGRPLPDGLSFEVLAEDPLAVLVNAAGPLAGRDHLTPDDLVLHGLWWPMAGSSRELRGALEAYAASIGAPLRDAGSNLGVDALVERVANEPAMIVPVVATWPLAKRAGVRVVALRPAPLFPWHAVWRTANDHPELPRVLRAVLLRHRVG